MKSSIISSDNPGDMHLTKRYGEKVAIEKINTHLSNKVMEIWKNILGDMTKQTIFLQNNIQEQNKILKNYYLPRNNVWTYFWVTLWVSINYVIPVIKE